MKDRSACIVGGLNCSSEYEDDLMECGDFLDLVGLTKEIDNGEVDIYMMAERIANLLGRSTDADLSYDDEDDEEEEEDDCTDDELVDDANTSSRVVDWSRDPDRDRNLLLAGYTSCMDEAIRYLVEEEQYAAEHPIVQGLKQHLAAQQERVLLEIPPTCATNLNNPTDARLAQRVDALCAIRPAPTI